MNKDGIIKAAYFACIAIGYTPSVRTVNDMVRRIRTNGKPGHGFRTEDIAEWFHRWETIGKQSGTEPETPIKHKIGSSGNTRETPRKPSRARHKELVITAITVPIGTAKGSRRMKQGALDLGAASVPEVDYDKPKLAIPENLPETFPDPNDDLLKLAEVFCSAFGGCKSAKAILKHRGGFNDTIAIMRQRGIRVSAAWQAFVDTVVTQEGRPLFGPQAKKALAYLRNERRPFKALPRVDSCGCPLPEGVTMPRLDRHDTAHWDGDEFIIGSDKDPK